MNSRTAVIILAAGLGTRMRSAKAKVLHELRGRPMVLYVLETAQKIAENRIIMVIGNQAAEVRRIVMDEFEGVSFALQEKQLGTGHAVRCALPYIPNQVDNVIILYGDVPLLTYATLKALCDDHIAAERDVTLLVVEADDPKGYGRVLLDDTYGMIGIVEEVDATESQKRIKTINTGIYCVNKQFLIESVQKIKPTNVQGELYLTDIIALGHAQGAAVGFVMGSNFQEIIGVNTYEDLIKAESILTSHTK